MAMATAEQLVVEALQAATSPNHEIVRKAEAQLTEWEQQPGFIPTLARLCMKITTANSNTTHLTPEDAVKVRWMAAVYLKNAIERYWRPNTRLELPADQKQQIRDVLIQHYDNEDVPQVALQVAVLLGRISRTDYPRYWPDLMPTLMKQLQSCASNCDPMRQQRVLIVLHYVIKALASRRILAEKRIFQELSQQIFNYLAWDTWSVLTTRFMQLAKSSTASTASSVSSSSVGVTTTDVEAETLNCLQRAYIVMRSLRKLAVYGCSEPYKSTDYMNFIKQLFEELRSCLELRYELRQMRRLPLVLPELERFILKMMKTLNEFMESYSLSFARFVSTALDFSFHYVFHEGTALIFDAGEQINFTNFAIQAMNMIKGIMLNGNDTIQQDQVNGGTLEDELLALSVQSKSNFFTTERIKYICEKIITHYFLLTPEELQEWQNDPETFGQDDGGGDAWKYGLRPSVETLYCTCFTQHSQVVVNEVLKFVRKAQQQELTAEADLKDILLKDAIYNAVGQASFQFFNKIDFGSWLTSQLLAELRIDAPNFRILRRRIIWLVGHWVSLQLPRELRPVAYEACLHLLRPQEDMPIRLEAARTLNVLIDDFEFLAEAFHPYFSSLFNALFLLLREASECDTKIVVLGTMTLLVEKMSDFIEPQAMQFISYLPMLWKESEEYNMLRCAIIRTLEQLMRTIRDVPEPMKPFIYSVIDLSTDLKQRSHVYLIEDGIMLWLALIGNSTALNSELLALCDRLLPIIEMSSENLRTVLQLIRAYILLDAQAYLTRYGEKFVEFCVRSFEDIRTEGIMAMLRIFETCLIVDPAMGLRLVRPALPFVFQQVYLKQEYPMTMGWYLTMVARTLLIDQAVFMSVVQQLQQPDALAVILDVWIEMFPLVPETHVEKRKLFSLAFASIFGDNELLLVRFAHIMQLIDETLTEVMDKHFQTSPETETTETPALSAARYYDSLVIHDEHELDELPLGMCQPKSYHDDRHRQLVLKDPVYKISLTEYLKWQLNSMKQQLGAGRYEELLRTVCPEVLSKINMYIEQTVPKSVCPICSDVSDDSDVGVGLTRLQI